MGTKLKSSREIKSMKTSNNVFKVSVIAFAVMCSSSAMASSFSFKKPFEFKKKEAPVLQDETTNVSIYDLSVSEAKDGSAEFKINFNGFAVKPKATRLAAANQLVLNFGKIDIGLNPGSIYPSLKQFTKFALTKNSSGEAVLTVDLNDFSRFTTRAESGIVYINIHASTPTSFAESVVASSSVSGVSGVSYTRTKGGEDQTVVTLTNPKTEYKIDQVGNKIVIRFPGVNLPAGLVKNQNFNDVKAIVTSAKVYNDKKDGVIELTPKGSYDYQVYQLDKKLTISVAKKAVTKGSALSLNNQNFKGKKISMDFQDVEVRHVLQLLANYTDINIVASDTVSGNISLRIRDVPWDQALSLILKTKGLSQRKDGSVIWVAPTDEVAKVEAQEIEALAQSVKLKPLETTFVQLNYAKADEIASIIRMQARAGGGLESNISYRLSHADGSGGQALLSPRGSVSFDARTNTLIINDTLDKIEQIKNVISQLDIPVRQVMVEARIVRASTNFSKNMGVKWNVRKMGSNPIGSNLVTLSNESKLIAGQDGAGGEEDDTPNLVNLDLGDVGGASSIAFGLINTSEALLGLELAALQSDGKGEVLSTPKVMTGDKQQATIKSGVNIPYQTIQDDTVTVTFQQAVLELDVTPSITPEGSVQMKLNIKKDTLGTLTAAGYAIDTNQLQTNVLVNDGETVVLGGLYEDTKSSGMEAVPYLSKIPVVGKLFQSKSTNDSKQELLIFITPKVINNNDSKTVVKNIK